MKCSWTSGIRRCWDLIVRNVEMVKCRSDLLGWRKALMIEEMKMTINIELREQYVILSFFTRCSVLLTSLLGLLLSQGR